MGKRGPRPKPTNLRVLHGDRADRNRTSARSYEPLLAWYDRLAVDLPLNARSETFEVGRQVPLGTANDVQLLVCSS
jgi:hypothetical protein